MRDKEKNKKCRAQSAIEYMLLLGATVAVILGGFSYWLNLARNEANLYVNGVTTEIMGDVPVSREYDVLYP